MVYDNVKNRVVGVDIGHDITSTAVVDVRGNFIARDQLPTAGIPNVSDYASMLCDHILTLVEANGGYESVRSVGVCCPSANFTSGCVENAANLAWKGIIPLAAMLRDRLGLAVAVGNNAHVRALGEYTFGVAHGMKDFILVTLGSGVGSCIFSNGHRHAGSDGWGGEIGHTCVKVGGRQCGCGNKGCLETYTSAKSLVLTTAEVLAGSDAPSALRQEKDITPPLLRQLCDDGDQLAIEVCRRTGELLGIGLANYASIIDPEAIVFTGREMVLGDWLLNPAYESFNAHVFHNIEGKVKFLTSNFEDKETNLLGASVLAWEVKEYSLFKE